MNILLVGNGEMAKEMATACNRHEVRYERLENQIPSLPPESTVAIHFGSGRQLPMLIDLCEREHIPIIQGSTNIQMTELWKVVMVNAPNLSLPMVRLLRSFPTFAKAIRSGMSVTIAESHQSGKKDTSGTARAIAENLEIAEQDIMPVRNKNLQLALGIPPEHLNGHAYHFFTFIGQGVEIQVTTKIHGRSTYAEGALLVAETLLTMKQSFRKGIYNLSDIMSYG